MADISIVPQETSAASQPCPVPAKGQEDEEFTAPPTAKRTTLRLLRAWFIALTVFGYGPSLTYAQLAWLFNDHQRWWMYCLYLTEVPLVGGACLMLLPSLWFQPIRHALRTREQGGVIDEAGYRRVYLRALELPWWTALSSLVAALLGYVIGLSALHVVAHQPWIEIAKTIPAIPLVGGMMGAFCYFGTARALHPVLVWCSRQCPQLRPPLGRPLATKFLVTTSVLAIAVLCLVQPAAYTLTQLTTERHLLRLAQRELRDQAPRLLATSEPSAQARALQEAALGPRGYVFIIDARGAVLSPHPKQYRDIHEERWYRLDAELAQPDHAWIDRVDQHRVVAVARPLGPARAVVSVAYPADFGLPLHYFLLFTGVVLVEVLVVVVVFGRYYTRSITTPLADLTQALHRIADRSDFSEQVPVTSNDELSELATAFNRMVEQLRTSRAQLEDYTKRLERSTQELSTLNQEMEDVLRVVSHDLRAPLINIQGFSKRLEPILQETMRAVTEMALTHQDPAVRTHGEQLKRNVEQRFGESLHFISKGIEKMDALLASLLAVSRVGRKADPMQPHDLDRILDDVLAIFDHQLKERAITVIRHPLPRAVACRRNEIDQVFSNLVSNAIHYMGPGGNRFIDIGGRIHDGMAECSITDTGIGIAPEDQERVFHMFTRLQSVEAPGEGVGLAYVRKIVRSHGGDIRVTSQRGQGSTFIFTLPIRPASGRG